MLMLFKVASFVPKFWKFIYPHFVKFFTLRRMGAYWLKCPPLILWK